MDRFRRLADGTVAATFLLILVGGVVRVSDSGLGCGPAGSGTHGWPLCGGRLLPFLDAPKEAIEFSHRILAAIVGLMILALAVWALRRLRDRKPIVRAAVAALVLVLVQGVLGGLTVEHGLDEALVAAHLVLAMLLLALLLVISWAARAEQAPPGPAAAGLRPLAILAATLVLAAIGSGGYMAGTEARGTAGFEPGQGAHLACGKEFPTCNGALLPFGSDRLVDIHLTHRVLMLLATIAVLALVGLGHRRRIGRHEALSAAGTLLLLQLMLGGMNVWLGEHATLVIAHLGVGTLLWATLVVAGLRLGPTPSNGRTAWKPA